MRANFRHLNLSDRIAIEKRLGVCKLKEIATKLGVSPSTISREIKKNSYKGKYVAEIADKLAKAKNQQKLHSAKKYNPELRKIIELKLSLDWSPEQISGYLKYRQSPLPSASYETIYLWIYQGIIKRQSEYRVKSYRNYRHKKGLKSRKSTDIGKIRVSERPSEINSRNTYGHWEGDLIVGANNQGAILTLVERKTLYLKVAHMKTKRADEFNRKLILAYSYLDNEDVKSITYDNGSESAHFKDCEELLGCDFYFAKPGSPWERGTNENTNGLLRRYFPKKMDLKSIDEDKLDSIVELLNNRPRKKIGYRTPAEALRQEQIALGI